MAALRDVVVVSACRTAIGAFGGSLKSIRGPNLAAVVMKEAIQRANIAPDVIDDIRFGCCLEDHDALNIARIASLVAGIPDTVPACTINRVCCSAMDAIQSATLQIQSGYSDTVLVGGVESMSNAYYFLPNARWGQRFQDAECCDSIIHALQVGTMYMPYPEDGPVVAMRGKKYIMGLTAEFLAQRHNISRQQQDEVALRSHNRAEQATVSGKFKAEIVPVEIKGKHGKPSIFVDKDEHFRTGLTMEALGQLPPAFIPKTGTVTAGNSSGINDGAAAMVLMSREKATALGLKPLATISGLGLAGNSPELMGESPVHSVKDLLRRNGRKIEDYGRIECNEAFASQYLSCEKTFGWNRDICNVNGSGIGLGHPVGCTGARIVVSLLYEMLQSQSKLGLATLCGGGGVSTATEITLC